MSKKPSVPLPRLEHVSSNYKTARSLLEILPMYHRYIILDLIYISPNHTLEAILFRWFINDECSPYEL